jgi:ATP-dependent Clp protease ATP-binding subunit ClpC
MADELQVIVRAASAIAQLNSRSHIAPVDLLAGILAERESFVAEFLKALGIDLNDVFPGLEQVVIRRAAEGRSVPLDEKADEVLERARRISSKLGHRYIGPEHLLLSLLGEEDVQLLLGRAAPTLVVPFIRGELLATLGADWPKT